MTEKEAREQLMTRTTRTARLRVLRDFVEYQGQPAYKPPLEIVLLNVVHLILADEEEKARIK